MHSFKEKSDTKQFFSDKVKQIQKRFPTTMKVNINKLNDLPKWTPNAGYKNKKNLKQRKIIYCGARKTEYLKQKEKCDS